MRSVIQRVSQASVKVEGEIVGKIAKGLMVLIGVGEDDNTEDVIWTAEKLSGLRIFEDDEEKMNLSIKDVGGDFLLVSQFTLYGDCRKGKRPSFSLAASPDQGRLLFEQLISEIRARGFKVETGVFQAHMEVELVNDGPVTIMLDSKKLF